jgi:hypothetical protein
MSAFNRALPLGGLIVILSALAFAIPADAAVKAECMVDGEAKATTTKPTPKKYVQMLGGKGTFTFGAALACSSLNTDKGVPSTLKLGNVGATGTFRNSMPGVVPGQWVDTPCGQGKVMGKVLTVTMNDPKYNVLLGKKFALDFGAPMNGLFYWHTANPNKPTALPKPNPDSGDPRYSGKVNTFGTKDYRYAGDIQLTPSESASKMPPEPGKVPPPADKCIPNGKGFHVTGTIMVDEA